MRWITAFFPLFFLASCQSVKYVPVERVHTDSVTIVRVDTFYVSNKVIDNTTKVTKDSVRESVKEHTTITVNDKGDTLRTDYIKETLKDHTLQQENNRLLAIIDSLRNISHDTITIVSTDSVQVPYPVERPLSKWQKVKQEIGGIAIGIALLAIVLGILAVIRHLRSNFL